MNIVNKIGLLLFTKPAGRIISKAGCFEVTVPYGYRYTKSKNLYQIFNPIDSTFILQISGFALHDIYENRFNVEQELANELKTNTNAIIVNVGPYRAVCSATIKSDNSQATYVWKIGEKNKRILITCLFWGLTKPQIDSKIHITDTILNQLLIIHNPAGAHL